MDAVRQAAVALLEAIDGDTGVWLGHPVVRRLRDALAAEQTAASEKDAAVKRYVTAAEAHLGAYGRRTRDEYHAAFDALSKHFEGGL